MIRIENHCRECGKPCIHEACPDYRVKVCYCDDCRTRFNEETPAVYAWGGAHYCEDHLDEELNSYFAEKYTQEEKLKLMLWNDFDYADEGEMFADLNYEFEGLLISDKISLLELDDEIEEV